MVSCDIAVVGKEYDVRDDLVMFVDRFVRTHMWNGPELTIGRTVHRCLFSSAGYPWPTSFHNDRTIHLRQYWVTFRTNNFLGLNIVDFTVACAVKGREFSVCGELGCY